MFTSLTCALPEKTFKLLGKISEHKEHTNRTKVSIGNERVNKSNGSLQIRRICSCAQYSNHQQWLWNSTGVQRGNLPCIARLQNMLREKLCKSAGANNCLFDALIKSMKGTSVIGSVANTDANNNLKKRVINTEYYIFFKNNLRVLTFFEVTRLF